MNLMLKKFLKSNSSFGYNFYTENEKILSFLFKIGAFLLGWKVLFHFVWNDPYWLSAYNAFSLIVIEFILHCCAFLLEVFQYNVEIDSVDRILRLKGTIGVTVGEPCIGFEVMSLFVALILSCRGAIIKKIWFIPLGVAIIYSLNLLRICALALLVRIDPAIWELNHKVIFSLIVYSFIFIMWSYWIKINSKTKKNTTKLSPSI